jgi:hypothetical protein
MFQVFELQVRMPMPLLPVGWIAAGPRLWYAFCPTYLALFVQQRNAGFSYHARYGAACFTIDRGAVQGIPRVFSTALLR